MASIKARLSNIEEKLSPPKKIDIVARLNAARQLLERRAAYRRDNQWEELETELFKSLQISFSSAKDAFEWLQKTPVDNLNWVARKNKQAEIHNLATVIDDLTDCRNRSKPAISDRASVFLGGVEVWGSVIREAEAILSE